MILIFVTAIIIIIFLCPHQKYCMNETVCKKIFRQNKTKDEHKGESLNHIEVILGSKGPEDELNDGSVKSMKVLKCGNCAKTPLCCNGCSQEAVIPS